MISKSLTRVLAAVALVALSGCGDNLYNGLTERDANEMVAVLLDAQVPATRVAGENGHYSIKIDKSSFSVAVKLLSNAGYPRDSFKSIDDVFPGGKLMQSPLEQRARFAFALSQDLSRSVSALRGISFARVHIALAQFDLRGTVISPASASVIIRYGESAELTEIVAQTREIVASGVEGLASENVKIPDGSTGCFSWPLFGDWCCSPWRRELPRPIWIGECARASSAADRARISAI